MLSIKRVCKSTSSAALRVASSSSKSSITHSSTVFKGLRRAHSENNILVFLSIHSLYIMKPKHFETATEQPFIFNVVKIAAAFRPDTDIGISIREEGNKIGSGSER